MTSRPCACALAGLWLCHFREFNGGGPSEREAERHDCGGQKDRGRRECLTGKHNVSKVF